MHHFGSTGSVRPNSLGRTCHSHVKLKSYQVKRLKSNQGSSASKMSRLCRTACLSLVLLFGEIFELVLSICSQLLRYWELLLPLLIPVKKQTLYLGPGRDYGGINIHHYLKNKYVWRRMWEYGLKYHSSFVTLKSTELVRVRTSLSIGSSSASSNLGIFRFTMVS